MSNIVITNINERIREVLAKYGMNTEYNPLSKETCIFCDNSAIGTLDYVTSVESGMKNVKISIDGLGLFSIEDGPDMEVDLRNMEDKLKTAFKPVGMKITVQYLDPTVKRLQIEKKGDWIDLYAAETATIHNTI